LAFGVEESTAYITPISAGGGEWGQKNVKMYRIFTKFRDINYRRLKIPVICGRINSKTTVCAGDVAASGGDFF